MIKNILVVGVGGQGVIMASDILADVALAQGFAAKKSEIHGMSQRGGIVSSHVRYGESVHASLIRKGQADILMAFELAEAVRWLDFLAPEGKIIANRQQITPPLVSMGLAQYPDDAVTSLVQRRADALIVDAMAVAEQLGNPRLVNTILLGVASRFLELTISNWEQVIDERLKPQLRVINRQAFQSGRALAA
jgi:indolepyruvate ferredoxin oxidoreductase beta subunit